MSRVLVIADQHHPFTHKDYLNHCKKQYKKYKCNRVVNIGDVIDHHTGSYHETDPNGLSPIEELRQTRISLKKWVRAFPKMDIMRGNHDELPFRKAKTMGYTRESMKSLNDTYDLPDAWNWHESTIIDGVLYTHGTGLSGKNAALNAAIGNRMSTVIGHVHSFAGIQWTASKQDLLFGMQVGWGGDIESYAFAYGKHFTSRPIMGCGIVINGTNPYYEPMIFK